MRKNYGEKRGLGMDELTKKWSQRDLSPLKFLKADQVNHTPHPFMVGPRHVSHAAKYCGGMLGMETINAIPCAWQNCGLYASEHEFDVVMMVQLTRNATKDEVSAVLKPICDEIEKDGIDGLTFVETAEKWRVV